MSSVESRFTDEEALNMWGSWNIVYVFLFASFFRCQVFKGPKGGKNHLLLRTLKKCLPSWGERREVYLFDVTWGSLKTPNVQGFFGSPT